MATHPEITIHSTVMEWLASLVAGCLLQVGEPTLLGWDFPPALIHILQMLAWVVNIIVGCITIYKWYKKNKE